MTRYNKNELDKLLEKANLSCYKIGKILDIPVYRVFKYLHEGDKIRPEEMLKLDAAIKVIRTCEARQPEWNPSLWWVHEEWDETVGKWNEGFREAVRREVQHQDEVACDRILFAIGFGNVNEYATTYDPLGRCGLDKYSVDTFCREFSEKVMEYM